MKVAWDYIEVFFYFSLKLMVKLKLLDLLQYLVGEKPKNWDLISSHAEFAYNNSVNMSTCKSPFEIIHGLSPRQPIDFLPLPTDYCLTDYAKFLLNIHIICMLRLDKKLLSNETYKLVVDAHRRHREFNKRVYDSHLLWTLP